MKIEKNTRAVSVIATGVPYPTDLVVDTNGDLFVTTGGGMNVTKVKPDGTTSVFASGISYPGSIVLLSDNSFLVAAGGSNSIVKVSQAGVVTTYYSSGISNPGGISMDKIGNLYFVEHQLGNLRMLTPDLILSKLGNTMPYGAGFTQVSPDGNLYVTDALQSSIFKYNNGNLDLFASGFTGKNNPPVIGPSDIAFDKDGNMFVADGNSVWKISPPISRPDSNDFDGDRKADLAVYRPSTGVWYILQSTDGYDPSKYKSYLWGGDPTDIPVPGDYDGDGKPDIAVYRSSTGVWYILQSSDGYDQSKYKAYRWGGNMDDIPIPRDVDGDGRADLVIYRPSSGVWYILQSSDVYDQSKYKAYKWGDPTDKPVMSFK